MTPSKRAAAISTSLHIARHRLIGGIMFGVLLESRSRRQRRNGGVALSVVAHLAIIGTATALTAHPRDTAQKERPREYILVAPPPVQPRTEPRTVHAEATSRASSPSRITITHIDVPTLTPTS